MNTEIIIENLKPVNAGNIKATLDVVMPDVSIHGCKIICQPGQKPWIALPSREWKTDQGERRFAPIITLNKELYSDVQRAALAVWEVQANA